MVDMQTDSKIARYGDALARDFLTRMFAPDADDVILRDAVTIWSGLPREDGGGGGCLLRPEDLDNLIEAARQEWQRTRHQR